MAIEKDFDNNNENAIEWLSREHYATVTFTDRKMINRVKKLYEDRKDEFKYLVENDDGSICAKLPKKWIKINAGSKPDPNKPKREMSEEQKLQEQTKPVIEKMVVDLMKDQPTDVVSVLLTLH